jgi:protein-tyrosine kinase
MSRIHDVLNKADRDGAARRTRISLPESVVPVGTRGQVESPPAPLETLPPAYVEPPVPSRPDGRAPIELPAGVGVESKGSTTGQPPPFTVEPRRHEPPQADVKVSKRPIAARADGLDPVLVAAVAPHSLAAEQYRALRTRIVQAENGRALRVVLVTSPGKGDGKSVSAANLALTMAQQFQQRVLLLDADLRRPQLHRLLGLGDGPGLADVLMGGADLDAALMPVPGRNLWVLPAGAPPGHPAELLGSSGMRRVLDTLRGRFDRIVVDTPPVAPLADVRILSPLADGIVLIVRAGVTLRPAIESALSGFDRERVLGVVLNAADPTESAPYTYAHDGGTIGG